MTPATIIHQAQSDGILLTLNSTGGIRATGDDEAIRRWLPTIRENKAGIVAHMTGKALGVPTPADGDDPPSPRPKAAAGKLNSHAVAIICQWLAFIGEDNPETIREVMERCASDSTALAYYLTRARDEGITIAAPPVSRCTDCTHLAKPGQAKGYCASGRDDLAPAYGAGHPLRRLPDDDGSGCTHFHPMLSSSAGTTRGSL